jgi:hypothetical protein
MPHPHSKFLHKLHQYGIKNKIHKWLTNFLKESMRTEGEKSNETTVVTFLIDGIVKLVSVFVESII